MIKGLSFTSLLTLVFITLKLTGVITWSWWLVLLPVLIIPCIITLVLLGILIRVLYLMTID